MKLTNEKSKKKSVNTPFTSGTKQYGLIIPKKDAKKKELATGFNVFAAAAKENNKLKAQEEDDQVNTRRRIGDEAVCSLQQSHVDKIRAQALAEDAAVFDYDAVYDDMKNARESQAIETAAKRELDKKRPKYIGTLLHQAKIREVENERIRERRLLNERNADEAQYRDKEKLVSASYKRKLQEMKKWEAEDAQLAAMEEQEDVTKQGEHAMAGFYANLNKNIAMGGTIANARSAYTVQETHGAITTSAEAARAERGHERDDSHGLELVKTHDKAATKEARSGEQLDDRRFSPARETLLESKDVHVKTDASLIQAEKIEKPSKEDAIAAAKARFLARKAQRKSHTDTVT
ncbi:unnamed protein product [Peronospora belbahrii]|uniref:Nuclear speckle splicing regulatory protein 1 N-terminal domain-containing protein n=1 Tax=Peronospora belbahrii TaxID=622444 RepID=A0AAU9L196_9STRA|nr:unnamed protein product [Peronospora belbahrii]CAH0514544.1 unnamed protein product [Peronospora belbahrii]